VVPGGVAGGVAGGVGGGADGGNTMLSVVLTIDWDTVWICAFSWGLESVVTIVTGVVETGAAGAVLPGAGGV